MKLTACVAFTFLLLGFCWTISCDSARHDERVLPHERSMLDSLTKRFFLEASIRGVDTSAWHRSVEVNLGSLPQDRAGSCQPDAFPKEVTIDHFYWKISNPKKREQLVFHELAHCLLERKHVNDTLRFGECKSWMRETDSDCLTNLDNNVWRTYYLDELFARQPIHLPSWYRDEATAPRIDPTRNHVLIPLTPSSTPP